MEAGAPDLDSVPSVNSTTFSVISTGLSPQAIVVPKPGCCQVDNHEAKADLLPGTLDMLVLKMLVRGHLHGYAIAQLIQQLSDDLLRVEEGSLYPALQRLELNGWIEGEWGLSANKRRARFYKLTADGRKHLTEESARYRQVTGAVARIMGFA